MLTRPQGTLDVMVQRTGDQGEGNVLFVQNNFYYDAFFLKAIGTSTLYPFPKPLPFSFPFSVLNGACGSGLCTAPNGSFRYHVRCFRY